MKQPLQILAATLTLRLLAGARGADSISETSSLDPAASDRVSARPDLVITTLGFGSYARQERTRSQ